MSCTRTPECDSQSCSFGFIFSGASICSTMAFPLMGNFYHLVVSVSIDFPSKHKTLFDCIAYDYSLADCDGLCDNFRDVPWEMSSDLVFLLPLVNFVIGFRLELKYISLIVNIRSNNTHLHGFQLLVLLA